MELLIGFVFRFAESDFDTQILGMFRAIDVPRLPEGGVRLRYSPSGPRLKL